MLALAAAVTLVAGCSALERQVSVSPTPSASPVIEASARPPWIEDLTFSGGLTGTLNQVVAGSAGLRTICTGKRAQGGTTWVLTLFGPVAGTVYGVQATVGDFRGPGRYRAPDAGVQVFSPDDSVGWRSLAGDPVSMLLEPGLESGTVDATLTDLADNSSKVHVSGRWTCQT
jgi:hypothetical protein